MFGTLGDKKATRLSPYRFHVVTILENLTSRLIFEHETELTPEQILEAFVNFKHKCGIKYECNSTKLVQSLKLLKIPNWFTIHRTNVSRNLIINIDVLREHFSSRM